MLPKRLLDDVENSGILGAESKADPKSDEPEATVIIGRDAETQMKGDKKKRIIITGPKIPWIL